MIQEWLRTVGEETEDADHERVEDIDWDELVMHAGCKDSCGAIQRDWI